MDAKRFKELYHKNVLGHENEGVERIAYASRYLNPSEMNYSQLDRGALAIILV